MPKSYVALFAWSFFVAASIVCLESLQGFGANLDEISLAMQVNRAPQASLVFDRDNHVVFSFAREDRTNVSLDQISAALISAVLAAEDRHFFDHAGLDVTAIARAALVDLRHRETRQGGSTITQQLVRQLALTRERTFTRKVKEALLALRLERRFDKRQILEAYLNQIYLGNGHYGVEAASRGYLGKSASELTAPQAALLAGLIKCPSACSPRTAPAVARARRNGVLRTMHNRGSLNDDDYRNAVATPIALVPERADEQVDQAGLFFFEAVRRQLVVQFGDSMLLSGGLRIHTTLDMTMQRQAQRAVQERVNQIDPKAGGKPLRDRLEGAMVALDPHTGEVLALVGGRNFFDSPFDRATQARRQPGSAFKPLLFAAAIEQGYSPSTLVSDLDTPVSTPQGNWLPDDDHTNESVTLRQALVISSNRAAVRLMQLVGVSTTLTYARRLGITSPLPSVPSLAIGTAETSLLDLTSAYGAFANGGIEAPAVLVTRVEDPDGQLLWQRSDARQPYQAIRPGTAFLISSMLADVVDRGTAARVRSEGFRLPAAGKTGTTDDFGDAWFIGYTPSLVAGFWFGYDDHRTIMNRGFAGTIAVPAWARFMIMATAGKPPEWFTPPTDVEHVSICRASGLRASPSCWLITDEDGRPNVYSEDFLIGTAPYGICPGHEAPVTGPAPVIVGVD
jgi:1A family penicillin-binding protein